MAIKRYYTPVEAAEIAHRHPETVRDALRAGELIGVQNSEGGPWLIREDMLENWIESAPKKRKRAA